MRRTPLARTGRLPQRSAKTEQVYVARRSLRRELLAERPWCEIRWNDNCEGRAVDLDEILSRAQGGSILDPANIQVTCRSCHSAKHAAPTEAEQRGFTVQRRHLPSDAQEAS